VRLGKGEDEMGELENEMVVRSLLGKLVLGCSDDQCHLSGRR
jgi:hypothetical protein